MDISKIDFYVKNGPGAIDEIDKLEKEEGFIFPDVYKELLLQFNGFNTNETILVLDRCFFIFINFISPFTKKL